MADPVADQRYIAVPWEVEPISLKCHLSRTAPACVRDVQKTWRLCGGGGLQ